MMIVNYQSQELSIETQKDKRMEYQSMAMFWPCPVDGFLDFFTFYVKIYTEKEVAE